MYINVDNYADNAVPLLLVFRSNLVFQVFQLVPINIHQKMNGIRSKKIR